MSELTSCQSSLRAGEPIHASATQASIWICLEYRGAWARKAFKSSDLPAKLKSPLAAALEATPKTRLQLIRRPGRTRGPLCLYLALWAPAGPRAYRFDFEDYGQLAKLDLPALCAGVPPAGAQPESQPWVLVCGNGRRDVCCARHGVVSYRALAGRVPAEVWLSDHQGGHRFAGNGLVLPAGIHLGRLSPGNARRVVTECLQAKWDFDHTRGHAAYPAVAQAGEHYLRLRLGLMGLADLRLVSSAPEPDGTWKVIFAITATGEQQVIRLAEGPSSYQVVKTTGDPAPGRVSVFTLV